MRPRLVYFDQWTDPVAGEVLADHGGFDVTRLEITGDVDANWAGLERAHGYQSLIRTELARNPGVAEQWICGPALLDRCPTCSRCARRARATTSSTSTRAPLPV